MLHESFEQAIRRLQRRRPQRPFTVELVTGERIVVRHIETLDVGEALIRFVEPDGAYRMFDATSICQIHSI